jgi:hypothetical protein
MPKLSIQADDHPINTDALVLIVVGAHPRAERNDRPIAYRLAQTIENALSTKFKDEIGGSPISVLVVSDVWYLNDASLRACPVISIGAPGSNAFSAYLGDKLPSAFVIDDTLMVQMDPELGELTVCCWGVDTQSTSAAVTAFCDRWLGQFVDAACRAMV